MAINNSRTKKAFRNSSVALLGQGVALVCGFILPRLILINFGSKYNGITSSISQFIECIVLLRTGVGGVTRASLYRPLAEHDTAKINGIVNATQQFMRKVAIIFAVGLAIFACIYPFFVAEEFDWLFTASLVLILGISTFAQNYFGITYQILVEADQKSYIFTLLSIVSTILNTVFAVFLINVGAGIHLVKLGSALAFSVNPLVLFFYARKAYHLDPHIPPDNSAIMQRWDAFAQQVATFVTNNTDIMVLTVFANLNEVSVYSVYYLIAGRLTTLVQTVTNGMDAAFGNVLAKRESNILQENFRIYEQLLYTVSTFAFGCAMFLIEPFVMVYTTGVTDVNYSRQIFGMLMCFNQFLFCVRLPYQMLTYAAGHFKQTRNGAIFEAVMNVTVSIALVIGYGLIGVTIGTFCAYCFRTFQYAIYSSKRLLQRSIWVMLKLLITSIFELSISFILIRIIHKLSYFQTIDSYGKWFVYAICVALILGTIIILFSLLIFNKQTKMMLRKMRFAVKK